MDMVHTRTSSGRKLKALTWLFFVLCFGLLFCLVGCASIQSTDNEVEVAVGRLVILHDLKFGYTYDDNPFGSSEVFQEFLSIYKSKVKYLPVEQRVDYFWASMWHLDFDGHLMEEFQEIVYKDCDRAFISRLEKFVEREKELNRGRARLYLSEKVLRGLRLIKQKEQGIVK